MVAIQGLGGIPEPKPEQPSKVRKDRDTSATSSTVSGASGSGSDQDEFVISSEARAAAVVANTIAAAAGQTEIRNEKVAAAKERLERGDYKDPALVAKTAEKLLKHLS